MVYHIPIKLSKEFMMRVHSHPIFEDIKGLSFDDPFYQSMWKEAPDIIDFNFGGWNSTQFNTPSEAADFYSTYKKLLEKSNIDSIHEGHLLYITAFKFLDSEKQATENYIFNYHKASGDFLLELYIKGIEHFNQMKKDPKYYMIYDESTRETFFSLMDPQIHKDIDDHYVTGSVHYQSFPIGKSVIRIPHSFQLSLFNSLDKNRTPYIDIPSTFKRDFLTETIRKMIREHEDKETHYMEIFNQESIDIRKLKTIATKKKNLISEDVTILNIGNVIHDYLKSKYPRITKAEICSFLWEFFALLKAYKIKNDLVPPTAYSELKDFYLSQKITKESIRLKFKDISIEGYF